MTYLLLFSTNLLLIIIKFLNPVQSIEYNSNKTLNQLHTLNNIYHNNDSHLPKNINPLKYKIYLIPYLKVNNFTFDGHVNMTLDILNDTSSIILHADQLNITDINVYLINTATFIEVYEYKLSLHQKLIIILKNIIYTGSQLIVNIQYSGLINEEMKGFFRSSYKDADGNTHWLAATHFQKFDARRAFPCFDEPAYKARFEISIMRPNHYQTLSNMNLETSKPSTKINWTWDHFKESSIMSTYHVAFVISDFQYNLNLNNFFTFSSYQNVSHYGNHVLKIGQKSVHFLENYTGIPCPSDKMNFVQIPDFPFDSIENWALNILSDVLPLFTNDSLVSTSLLIGADFNIVHEIAHMWFGNLVTSEKWEYLWLKEGFASYFEWLVIDYYQPKSGWMQLFTGYLVQEALIADSQISTLPMNDVRENFLADIDDNMITNQKSASIIRMIQHAFGEDVFHSAVKHYLKENQFNTTTPSDLWVSIQVAIDQIGGLLGVHQNVSTLMESWVSQPGYPVVHVTKVDDILVLSQERFLITGGNESSKELYWIPITIASATNPDFVNTLPITWMGVKKLNITIPNMNDDWIILNIQQAGFYRVNYDWDSWLHIFDTLNDHNFGGIPEINRAQIIDDLFSLARADYITYDLALSGSQYLIKETDHLPWKAFLRAIDILYEKFDNPIVEMKLKNYFVKLISFVYNQIELKKDTTDSRSVNLHKELIFWWACKLDHPHCIDYSRKIFDSIRSNSNTFVPPGIKLTVFCSALKHGSYDDWKFLWDEYQKLNHKFEKSLFLNVLGCSHNDTAIYEYLHRIVFSNGFLQKQDSEMALMSIFSAGRYEVDASLDFFLEYCNDTRNSSHIWNLIGSLLPELATKISTRVQISKFSHLLQNIQESIDQNDDFSQESILSVIEKNRQWYDNHINAIENWSM